jgi:hypothetical protein
MDGSSPANAIRLSETNIKENTDKTDLFIYCLLKKNLLYIYEFIYVLIAKI